MAHDVQAGGGSLVKSAADKRKEAVRRTASKALALLQRNPMPSSLNGFRSELADWNRFPGTKGVEDFGVTEGEMKELETKAKAAKK